MKKLILSIALLSCITAKSQQLSAAKELEIYTDHYYKGVAITSFGAILAGSSIVSGTHTDLGKSLVISGGISMLIGVFLTLESHSHIEKAGKLLNKEVVYLPSNEGLGVCIKF